MPKVAILGASGTVGLTLAERLRGLDNIEVQSLSARNTDYSTIAADVAVLCLPPAVAREAAAGLPPNIRVLDCSAAHRQESGWVYGLPELAFEQISHIRRAARVANPGCFATGAILLLAPLQRQGWLNSVTVSIFGIGGYTSGGARMCDEQAASPFPFRLYGLDLNHRHVPEIERHAGLMHRPLFTAGVGSHPCGTLIQIPLPLDALGVAYPEVLKCLQTAYSGTAIRVHPEAPAYLTPDALAETDDLELFVLPGQAPSTALLLARYDNLGKGAAGAALQNLRLMLDL